MGKRLRAASVRCSAGLFAITLVGCGSGGIAPTGTPPLTGTPELQIAPASLTFGTIAAGSASAPQTVTLTSSGTAAVLLSAIKVGTNFTQTSSTCPASLAVGASCTLSISFAPGAAGALTGTLLVASNAAGSPATVALMGTGVAPVPYAGKGFNVTAMAGAAPISGATVQLYAAGSSGNGSAGTAMLPAGVNTSASGTAAIPASYTCPSAGALLYVVSTSGAVITKSIPAAALNPNIVLLAALGPCNAITPGSSFVVNEATTIAAAYALAPFYSAANGGGIGATGSNQTGITNAFATAASLTNPQTGTSPGATLPVTAISPAPRVNSLANLLNACTSSASACASLYTAATGSGAGAPANTLAAAFAVARNPASNVAALYAETLASSAFTPVLPSVPADWTMFVSYGGGGLNNPSGLGVDSAGNVWVANYFFVASKFSPVGTPIFVNGVGGNGLNNSYGLAIDQNDNAWIPNEQPFTGAGIGSVSELTPAGVSAPGAPFVAGGLNYPVSTAIDPNGTVWVVDYGDSTVTLLNSLGTPVSGANGYTSTMFAFPIAVAVDSNHFGWVANQDGANVTRVSPDGTSFTNYACCHGASGIAIDQANNVWVANFYGDSVSLISNSGAILSNQGFTGAGSLYRPQGIALDGAGNVWVANYRAPYVTELAGVNSTVVGQSLSPAAGLGADAGLLEAYALAVDASGDVWVSDQGSNQVTKFIGLATPVKTPISGAAQAP